MIVIKKYIVKMINRNQFINLIESNIDNQGYHVTIVDGGNSPRYAYTIGVYEMLGFELIFSGGIYFMEDELYAIFNSIVEELCKEKGEKKIKKTISKLGDFSISKVDKTWSDLMLLGVFDYYKLKEVKSYQIKPDSKHFTLDIPDMSKRWSSNIDPVWQWLNKEWHYPVPVNSNVVTDIQVLQGSDIVEVMRWGNNEWEMFSSSSVDEEDIRVVPLGVILGLDESIEVAIHLKVEKGVWREDRESKWNDWG